MYTLLWIWTLVSMLIHFEYYSVTLFTVMYLGAIAMVVAGRVLASVPLVHSI